MMLEGKKIIVTGGGSGIGRATSILAAMEGADIAVADIDPEAGAETINRLGDLGRKAIFIKIWKAATAYVVGSIALIQLASVVFSNVSTMETFGYQTEAVMQFLFITVFS